MQGQRIYKNTIKNRVDILIKQALKTLGLEELFLLSLFRLRGGVAFLNRSGEWDVSNTSFSDWIWLCKALHLPLTMTETGYDEQLHERYVGEAIQQGNYILPWNPALKELYRRYLRHERYWMQRELEGIQGSILKRILHQRSARVRRLKKMRAAGRKQHLKVRQQMLMLSMVTSRSEVALLREISN